MRESLLTEAYILYRRAKASAGRIVFHYEALRHPIKKNKIVFCSTEGMGGYGDNPKAIAEYLHVHHPELELVWLLNDMTKEFPSYIRKAPNTLMSRAYEYSTAKVWIDCHRKPYGTVKRKGQYYMQTWHGTLGVKPVGADRGGKMPKIGEIVSRADSDMIDVWLSNSDWYDEVVRRGLYYKGEIMRTGSPRCDILFNEREKWRRIIREKYHIPSEDEILLFAPTFRAGSQARKRTVEAEPVALDFTKVLAALQKRTGRTWYLMLRLHPQVAAHMEKFPLEIQDVSHVVDASQYRDAYELLASVDAMMTDYSSLGFDASFIDLPVFLYADDLDTYQSDRNQLYFDLRKLPYPFAENETALISNIGSFDEEVYRRNVHAFLNGLGTKETGEACKRVAERIVAWIGA